DYRGIAIRKPDDVWIAVNTAEIGSAGALLHWNGTKLVRIEHVTANFLSDVAFVGNAIWAVGLGGVAAYSADGVKFRPVATGTSQTLEHVVALPNGAVIAAGHFGTILQR